MSKIYSYLFVAEKMKGNFADIYVQRAKALTYEMLYDTGDDKSTLFMRIKEQLFYAEQFSEEHQIGRLFVLRDFYYALYLLKYDDQESEWLRSCKKTNDRLTGKGDANDFEKILDYLICTVDI